MRNKFDTQLQLLDEQLIHMGELCVIAIGKATKALEEGNLQQAKEVVLADEEIDQMEKDIERLCLKLLLQQQPVARDLRRISAALKMITDMERIGDQTADIAEIIVSAKMTKAGDIQKIGEMADAVCRMVKDSVNAYVTRDLALAKNVTDADDEVDALFEAVREALVEIIAGGKKYDGKRIIDLLMVSKYLERIGDHATNIAEWVEFSITGIHKDSGEHSV